MYGPLWAVFLIGTSCLVCVYVRGFGGGWMLAFCSRPKPLVMKNLTPYLYLTLGREGIGRTVHVL